LNAVSEKIDEYDAFIFTAEALKAVNLKFATLKS